MVDLTKLDESLAKLEETAQQLYGATHSLEKRDRELIQRNDELLQEVYEQMDAVEKEYASYGIFSPVIVQKLSLSAREKLELIAREE